MLSYFLHQPHGDLSLLGHRVHLDQPGHGRHLKSHKVKGLEDHQGSQEEVC